MSITVRAAAVSDIDAISAIYAHAVAHGTASYELEPPSRDEMAERFAAITAKGYPYLAGERDGVVIGYAYASAFRARRAYRFMVEDSIYIAPDAQGLGVGAVLMTALIDACEKLGVRQITAVIGDGEVNRASVRLHEKAGFSHAGLLRGSGYKHGRWLDTVFMQLSLNGGATTPPDLQSAADRF